MGANAQTTVQKFVDGAVLTAPQQNFSAATGVPVFATTVTRDAAFGGANKVLAQGQLCYLEATNVLQFYDGAAWASVGAGMITKVEVFKVGGTFTPPTGATYAIATMVGGGGGTGSASSGTGGTSSVAFAAGTITAVGGDGMNLSGLGVIDTAAGQANSGNGAALAAYGPTSVYAAGLGGPLNGAVIIAGGAVTAGVGVTVLVGSGGVAGTSGAAGGTGYVSISYQVPA